MARRTIFAIGLDLPDVDGFECFPIDSDQSLLDADIILFRPNLFGFGVYGSQQYQGRPLLSEQHSFKLSEKINHWNQQIRTACQFGKTVGIFLPSRQEVFKHVGETYSGSGRSMVKTAQVAHASNYDFLPIKFEALVPGQGRAMRLAPDSEVIAPYWQQFSSISAYEVYFSIKARPLILTKSGDRMVGAMITSGGHVICLPNIEWDANTFVTKDHERWTKVAEKFAYSLRDAFFEIDSRIRADRDESPEPDWVKSDSFRLAAEREVEAELLDIGNKIDDLIRGREDKRGALKRHASLRALLFEKGHRLESAVREGLAIIGFDAQQFKQGDSEFDAIFSGPEGRFVGEVEGKDKNALNIDKFSQLERNIHEDLAREDVFAPAKGVLFGNAHRLLPMEERGDFFTTKVLSAAARTGCCLVRTPDLFKVARYVKDTGDDKFAEQCRQIISATAGAVAAFPDIPDAEQKEVVD